MRRCGDRCTVFDEVLPERGQRLGAVGAVLVGVAAVVPWAGGGVTVVAPTGLRWVVLGAAFLAWVVVLFRRWSAVEQVVVAAAGALVLGIVGGRLVVGGGGGFGWFLGVFGALLVVSGGAVDFLAGPPE